MQKLFEAATTATEQGKVQAKLQNVQHDLMELDHEIQNLEDKAVQNEEAKANNKSSYRDRPDTVMSSTEVPTTGQADVKRLASILRDGLRLPDSLEPLNLNTGMGLRDSEAVVCYKAGFGKPAIVLNNEILDWPIYRIRKDVLIQDSDRNLMDWRRAGKLKDPEVGTK